MNRTLAIRLYAVPELITKSKCAVLISVNVSKMLIALFVNLNMINIFTQCVKKEVPGKASMSIFSSNNLYKNTLFFYNSSRKITYAIES